MAVATPRGPLSAFKNLDEHEQEYLDAKLGTIPDDELAENIRQYRAIKVADTNDTTDTPQSSDTSRDVPATDPSRYDHVPSLDEFLAEAKPLNKGVPENQLISFWSKNFGHTEDPKSLPTYDDFIKEAKPLNPDRPESELKEYWQAAFGDRGAREKPTPSPGIMGTTKDIGLKVAAGVVDVAQSAVGLASLASGGKAGDILRDWGWNPEEANKFLNSKTSEAQQEADKAVADATGFVDTAIAYAKNPRAIVGGLAEAAPGIATMGLSARKAAVMIGTKAAAKFGGLATAEGAAAAKAAIEAAAGKLMWVSSGTEGALSAGQIADQAQAQGREYSDYLLPSVAAGAGTAVIGRAAGGLLGSAEIPLFTGAQAGGIKGNLATRVAKSLFSEGFLEEMPQSAQEQVFQNIAEDKPWKDGVAEAAASGLVIGGAMGGVMGGVQRPTPQQVAQPAETKPVPMENIPAAIGITDPDITVDDAIAKAAAIVAAKPDKLSQLAQRMADNAAVISGERLPTQEEAARLSTRIPQQATEIPILPGAEPQEQPLIQPGTAFTPRQATEPDHRAAMQAERERILAMRAKQPISTTETPEPLATTGEDSARQVPLQSAAELASPESDRGRVVTQLELLLRQNRAAKRPSQETPLIQGATLPEEAAIQPGSTFTPRQEQELTPKERMAAERTKLLAMRQARPVAPQPVETAIPEPGLSDRLLPSAAEKAYPSVDDLHTLAESKGLEWDNNPVFMEMTKLVTGKSHLDDLTPQERQRFADRLEKIQGKAPLSPTKPPKTEQQAIELPTGEQATEQLSTIEAAQVPRSQLAPEQNAELLARAEKAQADLEIAGTERGGRYFNETLGQGGTQEVIGLKSATASWYKSATSGPQALSRQRVDIAVAKILEDKGRDVGKDVQRIKELLLQDREFTSSPFAPKTDADWTALIAEATHQPVAGTTPIDQAAHVAATSPKNELPEPTPAQSEAVNYQLGHTRIAGLDISIEHPEGSTRSGADASGKPWSVTMKDHYGYIRGTKGKDKDQIDVYLKPGTPEEYNGPVFVVDQKNKAGQFDEHKVIIGASSIEDAKRLYQENYNPDWDGILSVKSFTTMPEFKLWLKAGNKQRPAGTETAPLPKPLNMAGEPRKEKPKAPPSPLYLALPAKTREKFEAAWTGSEQGDRPSIRTMKEWLYLSNKSLRAEFERRSGTKLPKGLAATNAAVEEYFGKQKVETVAPIPETKPIPAETTQPIGEPFALKAETVKPPKQKAPEQLGIPVPAPTVGEKPIIGREVDTATAETEAPLFSKAAQTPEAEQTALPETKPEPTTILANALRTAADQIEGKPQPVAAAKKPPKAETAMVGLEDVGKKIGGARKDKWAERGLTLADLEGMTGGEEAKFIVKQNIWRPDYAAMVTAGTEPKAAAMVKLVYDQLAAKPLKDTEEGRRQYLTMMGYVKQALGAVRTVDDVKNAGNNIRYDLVGLPRPNGMRGTSSEDRAALQPKFDTFWSVVKGRHDPFHVGYSENGRAARMVEQGFPNQEPWTRRYEVRQEHHPGNLTDHGAGVYSKRVFESNDPITASFENEQDLAKRFKETGIWRVTEMGTGKILAYRLDEASAKARAQELYETKKDGADEGQEPVRPHLDTLTREGEDYRNGRDVTAEDFQTAFGFRGVEFGNWAASDERQKHINQAYDALRDMADVLGLPPKAISLNGTLGMAFGARGIGKFAAHYEPSKLVINITKINGPGSMAHEWGHGLDHYFGELDRPDAYKGAAKGASGWYTMSRYTGIPTSRPTFKEGKKYGTEVAYRLNNLRPEMAVAFDKVMSTLFERNLSKAEAVRDSELNLEKIKKAIEEYSGKGEGFNEYVGSLKVREDAAGRVLAKLTEEDRPEGGYGKVDTSFYKAAQTLSGTTGDYWKRPTEMFARSFESYVFDRLGKKSDYLVHGVEPDKFTKEKGYKENPYPAGVDRPAINGAFNKLFDTMQSKETPEGVALFERRSTETPVTLSKKVQLLKDQHFDLKQIDNRRFMFHPQTRELVLGKESTRNVAQSSHADEFHKSGAEGKYDEFARGWIGVSKEYPDGVIHFAPPLLKKDFADYPETADAAVSTLEMFARNGATENTVLRNVGDMGERKLGESDFSHLLNDQTLFKRRDKSRLAPTMAQFAQAIDEGVSIGNTGQRVIDSSQQYPPDMIEALASKPYVQRLSNTMKGIFDEIHTALKAADRFFGDTTYIGLSPDDYYVGVNLDGLDVVMLNPWVAMWKVQQHVKAGSIAEADTQEYVAGTLVNTLVHELTHQQVSTSHSDSATAEFDRQLAQNHAILGPTRLVGFQRRLMDVLTGGTTDALASDLNAQLPFWHGRTRLSDKSRSRDAESGTAINRQNVAGEGTVGRTGPPADLQRGRTREAGALDRSAEFQRRDEPASVTNTEDDSVTTFLPATDTDTGTVTPTTARDHLGAAKAAARPYLLGALGLQQISEVYGREHAEVGRYNDASQRMEADFTEMSNESDALIKRWDKLKVEVADKMARVMEDARFANFDADKTKNPLQPSTVDQRNLTARFDALPAEAQELYRAVRDYYHTLSQHRFTAIKERIERSGGSPANLKAMIDRLELAYEKTRAKVYFPFTRFGAHIVVAKKMANGREQDRFVETFDSPMEAQKYAVLMKAKGWTVKQTTSTQYSREQDGSASEAVKEMLGVIDELDFEETLPGLTSMREQLKDSLNQTFINSLPDMSYAKHFIHAKDVKGFSKDALRAFAHSALHGAHHIARIQNADQLTKALSDLNQRIQQTEEGDVTEARQVYNELIQRHEQILNPNTHPVAAWLGQLGFTMSLGGVVATGLTNATQVPLITLPWMGSRFGFMKSAKALAVAYKDFLDPKTLNAESLFDASKSTKLQESERAMLKELQRRGRIDLTQTMDLAGRASQDNLSRVAKQVGTLRGRVAQMLGFTFHAPEVMNRQVTALATYRLAKERGASEAAALDKAEQAIVDTHFIYSSENRARYMSGNVLRVLTMFKQYSQNIAFLYGRAAQVWLDKNGATPEERKIARRQLLSMTSLQFAAAGALGMPFVGTVASLVTAILNGFGDDDDKKDWEVELRHLLTEQFGKDAGEVLAHGASRLTPWDMAARLGQSDLFFRAPQREREGRAAAMDWVTSFAGPVLGYAVNAYLGTGDVVKGIKDADAGHFLRGVEELTPSVIRHSVRALRFELEGGVRTRDLHKQMDVSYAEKLGQFFGFNPARAAEMYEGSTAIKNTEHQLTQRRNELLDLYAAAYQDRDQAARQRILEDVREFNRKYPYLGISGDTLMKSLRGRAQRERGTQGGLYLPRRREPIRERGSFANF